MEDESTLPIMLFDFCIVQSSDVINMQCLNTAAAWELNSLICFWLLVCGRSVLKTFPNKHYGVGLGDVSAKKKAFLQLVLNENF